MPAQRLALEGGRAVAPATIGGWLGLYATIELGVALLFGGGTIQGLLSDGIVQLTSLPLLGLAIYVAYAEGLGRPARIALYIIAGGLLLFILQLIPLPPALWTHLPGRAIVATADKTAGAPLEWMPLSLDPRATWFSFFAILPGLALFLATCLVDWRTRGRMASLIIAFALLSVFLGFAQIAGGAESPLRLYRPTNTTSSVGFFANRNHYAALLYATIPLLAVKVVKLASEEGPRRLFWMAMAVVAYGVIFLSLAMAQSRAGLSLAALAGLASLAIGFASMPKSLRARRGRGVLLVFLLANLIGLGFAFQYGFVGVANRVEQDSLMTDLRWPIARITSDAIKATFPFGVGFGAFEPVYQIYERPSVVVPPYINHAHDDWLELALDGGAPAIALAVAFLAWFAWAAARLWRAPAPAGNIGDSALARAGPVIALLFLLHSTVDYPMRTTTISSVFAFACALLAAGSQSARLLKTR